MPPAAEGGQVGGTRRGHAARRPSGHAAGRLAGLLLDIGGVVHSTAMHLVERLAETEPAMRPVLEQIGGLASDRDELWQQMLRRQVPNGSTVPREPPSSAPRWARPGTPGP